MKWLFCLLLVPCVLVATPVLCDTIDGATLARQGNGRGVAPCMACHGMDGAGQPAAGFPRLAGLPRAYLLKQLQDFASGVRANVTMQPVASGLNDAERLALASYYSHLPLPVNGNAAVSVGNAARLGQQLATRGRWADGLPACEQCHGPGGVGVGDHFPPLAGQSAVYLSNQLHAWQHGVRHNDPLQLMKSVTSKLSEADIAAVSAWYAAQSAAPTRDRP